MKFINQIEPWIGKEEQKAVSAYLGTGGWLTEFKKTKEFEEHIARYVNAKYVSVVANGTLALTAALLARGIGPGDEVIVPDYTMIASANAVKLAGAEPVLVDIDPLHLCLNFELTKKAIRKRTKAIILVTLNGRYPRIEKFVAFARKYKIFLLEDAAQSLGSRYKGKHLGMWGDAGIFSFSFAKIITTGQGGAVATNSKKLYERVLKIKDFGRVAPGIDSHDTLGYNFKFTDIQATIGVEQMKKLAWRVKRKKEIYRRYQKLLENIPGVGFIETDLKNTAPWFIDILVDKDLRQDLAAFLKERGVGTRPFYPAIHTQTPYRDKNKKQRFLCAEEISEKGLWLPSSSFLKNGEIVYIARAIRKFFKEV